MGIRRARRRVFFRQDEDSSREPILTSIAALYACSLYTLDACGPAAFYLYLDKNGAEVGRAFRHPDARRPPPEEIGELVGNSPLCEEQCPVAASKRTIAASRPLRVRPQQSLEEERLCPTRVVVNQLLGTSMVPVSLRPRLSSSLDFRANVS